MIVLIILGIATVLFAAVAGVSATQVGGSAEPDDARQQADDLARERARQEACR